jgi:hypothetical protein
MTKPDDNTKALLEEYQNSLDIFKSLVDRDADPGMIRYQAKVIIGINENILTAIAGDINKWKP